MLPYHVILAVIRMVSFFMFGDVTIRWKQIVDYHYTGNSVNGTALKAMSIGIIKRASAIGLQAVAVTSYMGSANRSMWKRFGVICGKYSRTVNKVRHPCDPSRELYWELRVLVKFVTFLLYFHFPMLVYRKLN